MKKTASVFELMLMPFQMLYHVVLAIIVVVLPYAVLALVLFGLYQLIF